MIYFQFLRNSQGAELDTNLYEIFKIRKNSNVTRPLKKKKKKLPTPNLVQIGVVVKRWGWSLDRQMNPVKY